MKLKSIIHRRVRKWLAQKLLPEPRPRPEDFPRPALYDLDTKLEKYFSYDKGVFIEVGANDGMTQSNTYRLEMVRRWSGVLIEPIPELFERCKALRTRSQVFNCALVASDYREPTVKMHYANLMSLVQGAQGGGETEAAFLERGKTIQELEMTYELDVPARTLTSVLDACHPAIRRIDFFSLDVEGYELSVLRGLDLERYKPAHILVESWQGSEIEKHLAPWYEPVDVLTKHDVMYRRKR